jgi:hypothetical protein
MAHDEDFIYLGISSDRKAEVPRDSSFIAILDRKSLAVVDKITVPFPEIYDLLVISPEMAQAISQKKEKFQLSFDDDRIRGLEHNLEMSRQLIEQLKGDLEEAHKASYLFHRLRRRLKKGVADLKAGKGISHFFRG